MRGDRANKVCIQKIVKHCDEIIKMNKSHGEIREELDNNIEFQYACAMCIVQIGELVSRVDDELTQTHRDIPWRQLKGLRNIYAHDYERIDNDMIWETITVDIPDIKDKLVKLMNEEVSEDDHPLDI